LVRRDLLRVLNCTTVLVARGDAGNAAGAAIEDILLIAECSLEGEWDGQVRYLPLR
jgi:hypothetical protein